MRRFEFFEPATAGEAIALLARYGEKASVLAGGTDLLVEIKEQLRRPDCVIDLKHIPGLGELVCDPHQGLSFGALVTARQIETCEAVRRDFAGLAQAVRELGSIQIRNRATVVGNVCRASPSADTLPPLIADGATIRILGAGGERSVAMDAFFTGPGRTVLAPGEIATGIAVPAPAAGMGKCYIKHGRRKAMELATVGVAVNLTVSGDTCRDIRIVLGAVAPTPIRARKAEALLRGSKLAGEAIARAAEAAMDESSPISNVRASAGYRRAMVGELTRRAIERAREAVR